MDVDIAKVDHFFGDFGVLSAISFNQFLDKSLVSLFTLCNGEASTAASKHLQNLDVQQGFNNAAVLAFIKSATAQLTVLIAAPSVQILRCFKGKSKV